MSATIDIVILNYNTRGLLERLLPTVISCSQGEGINIVVADNASSDGSAEMVSAKFPDVELIEMSENRGYAGGYNACLAGRTADYFVLLNSDAEPTSGWLLPLLKMAEANPALGAAQPHLMDYYNRNKFEYAGAGGGFMDQYGYPFCRGRIFGNVEQNEGQYDDGLQVFWATGAALFISRKAWEATGGLDERFFAHMEEIDLCWRMQLLGFEVWSCPQSIVYHIGGATLSNQSPRKTYLNFRNNLLMLYKNLHPAERDGVIFRRKLFDGLAACFFILQGKVNHIPEIVKAHRHFDKMKRHLQPSSGAKLLADLPGIFMGSLVLSYFLRGKKVWSTLWK
jgi:GT2 family glycosyltransferase